MKTLIYSRPYQMAIEERPCPQLEAGYEQVVIRIGTAGICASNCMPFMARTHTDSQGWFSAMNWQEKLWRVSRRVFYLAIVSPPIR